ncbi:MAG: hypothetical protein JWN48_1371 [Myxococcaceae bacterium]|nr:hypothetical protein [Myxococcaceae bacterium]
MRSETELTRGHRLLALLVCALSSLLQLWTFGPDIPEGTFLLIAELDGHSAALADPANAIYAFARPPVFALMGELYWRPGAFLVFGYAAHVVLHAVMTWLVYIGTGQTAQSAPSRARLALALAVVLVVFPLAHLARVDDYGVSLIPHDSFCTFSHRTLFWIVLALATACAAKGRSRGALYLAALGCYVHPTAGIVGMLLFTGVSGACASALEVRALAPHVLTAWLIAVAPVLLKLRTPLALGPLESISPAVWYASMIKGEADDFSFLYQLVYRGALCVWIIALIAAVVIACRRSAGRRDRVLWAAGAPPILFLVGAVVEQLLCVTWPSPIIRVLVSLTPGYRLLSYAFFPLLVLLGRLAAQAAQRLSLGIVRARPSASAYVGRVPAALTLCAALLASGVLLGSSARRAHMPASLAYARWAMRAPRVEGIDTYLAHSAASGLSRYHTPDIDVLAAAANTYPQERSLLQIRAVDARQPEHSPDRAVRRTLEEPSLLALIAALRTQVPPDGGLIVPPYLRYLRDALPARAIFFQEHHDANLMMGSPLFFGFFRARMRDLLGLDYEGLPSSHSHLLATTMRDAYLRVDTGRAQALALKYRSFRYFVTERSHRLQFPVQASTAQFVVYDLRASASDRKPRIMTAR